MGMDETSCEGWDCEVAGGGEAVGQELGREGTGVMERTTDHSFSIGISILEPAPQPFPQPYPAWSYAKARRGTPASPQHLRIRCTSTRICKTFSASVFSVPRIKIAQRTPENGV